MDACRLVVDALHGSGLSGEGVVICTFSCRRTQFFAPPREDPDEDGFYDHELEGLRVIHNGADIGEVTGVTHGPAQSLLELTVDGDKEVLVPFVEEIVPDIDLEAGTCTITPPEGLLDL